MTRVIIVAARFVLGLSAISLAGLLAGYLPSGSPSSVFADAVFTVNSAGDGSDIAPGDGICSIAPDGPCTLRAAIQEANASAGTDTIEFNLPPAGGYVIASASALPGLVDSFVIDGTTQPGFSGQPLIKLDGTNVSEGNGLDVGWGGGTIRGVAVSGFPAHGIGVEGHGKTVIQGNVITSNGGPDRFGRPRGGIYLGEPGGHVVGGTSPGEANVIAHNGGHGVMVGYFSSNNTISGNSIYDNAGRGIGYEQLCPGIPCFPYPYDIRPNHFPVVTSAERVGDSIVVRGISNPSLDPLLRNPNVTLEFFASRSLEPGGYGEGEIFLGAARMFGYNFEETFPAPATGCIVTATGTTFRGDTSSFSRGALIDAAPGVITVNSAADPGDVDICADPCGHGGDGCTLRAAIELANATPGTDAIAFNIAGPRSISLKAPLPPLSDPIVIDGTTQPGFSGKPLIELDGSLAGQASGLDLIAGRSVVKGLVINRFNVGISVWSENNVIRGNFIGTDPSGTSARGNRYTGVYVPGAIGFNSLNNNVIGGATPADRNLISGNAWGVIAWGGIRLLGNFIGTDFTGTKSLGNASGGVWADNVAVGGPGPGEGNLISGNGGAGIALERGADVEANKIGTTANGKKPLGNAGAGIADVSGYGSVNARDNIIAYNGTYAINVSGGGGVSLGNSIHSNGAEGLVVYSDPPDYGVPPVVQSASRSQGRLTISGSAHTTPETALESEVFANEACDPSGYGEGQLPLGSVNVTTDGAGDASFSTSVDAPAGRFQYVTATVTTLIGGLPRDTSSFSNCLPVTR